MSDPVINPPLNPVYTGDTTHRQDSTGEIHDHGHHEHHKDNFITKYIFSQDHKMIAKQFLITGMFWALVGGMLSVIFRVQLGFPNQAFPILETIFGKWAPGGIISPDFYYMLITMHGTILVFFVLTAGLSGTFANLLIPLQIGARDMASPFLNMLSYWFFFMASVVMLASFFLPQGASDVGWTAYPPLSAVHEASPGSGAGMDFWLIGMALFIFSSLLGGLNYITTVLNLRTKGMSMSKMPLTIWALLITAVLGLLSFPVLLGAAILLIFDRTIGTSFYLDNIFINGHALPNDGGNAILYQHLFWFLGHPEVYIVILPAFGLVSEVLATNARKPIFGYRAMILSLLAIAIIAFVVWAHHMFVTGLNPFVASVFVFLTLLVAVPSAIKVFNWIATVWQGNIKFAPAMLFAIGFVSMFISGGLTGIFLGNSALDIELHDTYFVVAHFHIVMGISAFFGMFAGVYHWFPKMYGRLMNNTLGYIHFWVTMVGAYMIFWPMHYMGLAGVPRRYYSFDAFQSFNMFGGLNEFITMAAMLVFFAQLLFLINFFYSIFYGRKLTNENPWQSNTLEWTTPIKTGHGNWPGDLPTVYRWPYDYSKNGDEYIPQTTPLREGETGGH
ncbi:MAG: cbb3-type cytochrome c oxidase subunit I [Chitinophagales bacterium]|nr:cbb3-type cytochrome c oxidase subunit I [Chitinophagales bacterium]